MNKIAIYIMDKQVEMKCTLDLCIYIERGGFFLPFISRHQNSNSENFEVDFEFFFVIIYFSSFVFLIKNGSHTHISFLATNYFSLLHSSFTVNQP